MDSVRQDLRPSFSQLSAKFIAISISLAAALIIQSLFFNLEFVFWQAMREPAQVRPWWTIFGAVLLAAADQGVHWQGGGSLGWVLLTASILTSPLIFGRKAWVLAPLMLHLAFFGFLLSWLPLTRGVFTTEWTMRLLSSAAALVIGDLACCLIWRRAGRQSALQERA